MAITRSLPSFEPGTNAISTEAPAFPLLRDDLRQVAPVRFISITFLPGSAEARGDSASAFSMSHSRAIEATSPGRPQTATVGQYGSRFLVPGCGTATSPGGCGYVWAEVTDDTARACPAGCQFAGRPGRDPA